MYNWTNILLGAVVIGTLFGILWWQGQIKRLANYCQETWAELQKCAWPNWDELKGSTALITIMIALLGGFVVIVDTFLFKIFIH